MRVVVQRVTSARVTVAGELVASIDRPGLVALLGVTHDDGPAQISFLARKVWDLRILREEKSASDVGAPVLDFTGTMTHYTAIHKALSNAPLSEEKVRVLADAIYGKCDANDGIRDRVIDDPLGCRFDPAVDLKNRMCPAGADRDDCFTPRQIQTIRDIYRGPHDSRGVRIYKGMDLGSEWHWDETMFPHRGNRMVPSKLVYGVDHINFLFYEKSPGVPPTVAPPEVSRTRGTMPFTPVTPPATRTFSVTPRLLGPSLA